MVDAGGSRRPALHLRATQLSQKSARIPNYIERLHKEFNWQIKDADRAAISGYSGVPVFGAARLQSNRNAQCHGCKTLATKPSICQSTWPLDRMDPRCRTLRTPNSERRLRERTGWFRRLWQKLTEFTRLVDKICQARFEELTTNAPTPLSWKEYRKNHRTGSVASRRDKRRSWRGNKDGMRNRLHQAELDQDELIQISASPRIEQLQYLGC